MILAREVRPVIRGGTVSRTVGVGLAVGELVGLVPAVGVGEAVVLGVGVGEAEALGVAEAVADGDGASGGTAPSDGCASALPAATGRPVPSGQMAPFADSGSATSSTVTVPSATFTA